jgi:nitrogen regulatory protein P-II 1
MEQNNDTKALFIIVNAGFADDVIQVAREAGAKGATIINARGEGARHETIMGITLDSEKEIILCLVNEYTSIKIMDAIKDHAGVKTPAHSICFTMPVDSMIGVFTSAETD